LSEAKLLLATTNQGKIREIIRFLEELPLEVYSLSDLDKWEDCKETGTTFLENARAKSLFYGQIWDGLALAEDSGLVVDALNGAPGIFSARFSGPSSTDHKNIEKVLALMKGIPQEQRQANFVSCMVLSKKGRIIQEIQENANGYITHKECGQYGFGYDPIFFYPPLQKTFAELKPKEKNAVSHRGRALKKLKDFLSGFLYP